MAKKRATPPPPPRFRASPLNHLAERPRATRCCPVKLRGDEGGTTGVALFLRHAFTQPSAVQAAEEPCKQNTKRDEDMRDDLHCGTRAPPYKPRREAFPRGGSARHIASCHCCVRRVKVRMMRKAAETTPSRLGSQRAFDGSKLHADCRGEVFKVKRKEERLKNYFIPAGSTTPSSAEPHFFLGKVSPRTHMGE